MSKYAVMSTTPSDPSPSVVGMLEWRDGRFEATQKPPDDVQQFVDQVNAIDTWDTAAPPDRPNQEAPVAERSGPMPEQRASVTLKNRLNAQGYLFAPRSEVVNSRRDILLAATRYSEGDKVVMGDGTRGVVSEVRTAKFEGPDGETWDATTDSPVYVVATVEGAVATRASGLEKDDWTTGVDNPEDDLAEQAQAIRADIFAALPPDVDPVTDGTLTAGPTDFDFPPSWRKSETPARLILLDAWAGMGGQFDCGGGCCKGEMMSSGMSDRASDQFCAAMKDRVLMWEGWRKGGGEQAATGGSTRRGGDTSGYRPDWFRRLRRRLRAEIDRLLGGEAGFRVLRRVPVLPNPPDDRQGEVRLTREDLARWFVWLKAGRPKLSGDWNPALHPRGPDGQFVERPWDIPDDLKETARNADSQTLLRKMADDPKAVDVDAILQDPDIKIDGVPDDADSVDDLTEDDDGGSGGPIQFEDIDSITELSKGDTFVRRGEPYKVLQVVNPDDEDETWLEYADQTGEQFFVREDILMETDTRDKSPVESEIEERFGIKNANLSGLSESDQETVRDGLAEVWTDDFEDRMPILSLTTGLPEDDDDGASSAAFYRGSDRTLYVNPDSFEDFDPSGDDVFAFEEKQGVIHHEVGHARHFVRDPENYGDIRDRGLSESEQELARSEVSSYAAYTPHEFVAEVFAGRKAGKTYPPKVNELYQELGGPEVIK